MTGCGVATTTSVKISSATKASCTVSIGFDNEALTKLAQAMDTTKAQLLKELKKSDAKYTKKKLDGVEYHIFYSTIKNTKLNDAIFGTNNTNISVDDYSLYIGMKVTLDSKVNFTNGKVSNDGKTVSWVIKDSNKVTRLCASTTKVTRTAKSNSVVNGKTYKAGKKLTVANPKSLAKMKLDGTAVKPGKAVTKKGTHKLIIWSKDGKVQRVTFKIK